MKRRNGTGRTDRSNRTPPDSVKSLQGIREIHVNALPTDYKDRAKDLQMVCKCTVNRDGELFPNVLQRVCYGFGKRLRMARKCFAEHFARRSLRVCKEFQGPATWIGAPTNSAEFAVACFGGMHWDPASALLLAVRRVSFGAPLASLRATKAQ